MIERILTTTTRTGAITRNPTTRYYHRNRNRKKSKGRKPNTNSSMPSPAHVLLGGNRIPANWMTVGLVAQLHRLVKER